MISSDELMSLREYFEDAVGYGVLATANAEGEVNTALFARPHFLEKGEVGFIMPEGLTFENLSTNPHASFLFVERSEDAAQPSYRGRRLTLTRVAVEKDTERVGRLRRRTYDDEREGRYLVSFTIEWWRPLVGAG